MAVTRLTGFEAALESVDANITFSGAAYSTAQARTGVRSIRCNAASGVAAYSTAGGPFTASWVHFGLYVATMPTVSRTIAGLTGVGDSSLLLNSDGTISPATNGTSLGTSSTALTTGQWYWIGWRVGTGSAVVLQIDGVDQVTASPLTNVGSGYLGLRGTEASAADIYIDDLILDGAGFLAPSKVDLALPISDNNVVGVTDNNGVATNIWQCVSNIPPAGVASANEAANPKNGMHFPASATCSYRANLETYTTLGVASGDTVIAVQGVFRHGEDINTGTKNGSYMGTSNPVVDDNGGVGFGFVCGNDGGAHGAETGLWATRFGTIATFPTIILGNSPLMQINRAPESRLGCVDFMGMSVAWTPAAVETRVPYVPEQIPQLLAQ